MFDWVERTLLLITLVLLNLLVYRIYAEVFSALAKT